MANLERGSRLTSLTGDRSSTRRQLLRSKTTWKSPAPGNDSPMNSPLSSSPARPKFSLRPSKTNQRLKRVRVQERLVIGGGEVEGFGYFAGSGWRGGDD